MCIPLVKMASFGDDGIICMVESSFRVMTVDPSWCTTSSYVPESGSDTGSMLSRGVVAEFDLGVIVLGVEVDRDAMVDDLGVVVADFVPDDVAVTFALSGNSKWFSCRWSLGVLGALPPALPLDMVLVLVDALCLVDRSRAGTSTGLFLSIRVAMVM